MTLFFSLDGKRRVIFYIYGLTVFSEWATIQGIGKRATLNEALFFFSFLPEDTIKILCIKKEVNPKQKKSLAEYYVIQYGHIIDDVIILENSDEEGGKIENAWLDQNKVKNRDKLNLFFDTNSKKSEI